MTLAVTIKVVDQEDDGTVKFPHVREPQEGKSVLATAQVTRTVESRE